VGVRPQVRGACDPSWRGGRLCNAADPARGESLLEHVEHALKPWVNYAIMPVFAFANAGVPLIGIALSNLTTPITLGIITGLFVGKQIGVFGAAMAAIKFGIAERPPGASIAQIYGIAVLTGVGFTMSLFIGTLAFEDEALMAQVRLGVLFASSYLAR